MSISTKQEIQVVLKNLERRVNKLIGRDARNVFFETETMLDTVDGLTMEMTVGNLYVKELKHIEDFLYYNAKKDLDLLMKSEPQYKKYYFGLHSFNTTLGVITYGRACKL